MAEEREGLQKIKEISDGLWFCVVDLSQLQEQDINARMMKDNMLKQLSANIKKRGQLESVPFCCLKDGKIEIISGHHRTKAAKMAGLKQIPILLDVSGLNRSQIAAKQLAHNSISGFDDEDMLREIAKYITDVDDMLESFFVQEFDVPEASMDQFVHIKSDLDFKQVSLVFLDHQMEDIAEFFRKLDQSPDYIGLAEMNQFKEFCAALKKTQKVMDVKNVSAAVGTMVQICNEYYGENGYADGETYVPVHRILGGATCSKKAGETIKKALTKIVKEGKANSKWEALRVMAEE